MPCSITCSTKILYIVNSTIFASFSWLPIVNFLWCKVCTFYLSLRKMAQSSSLGHICTYWTAFSTNRFKPFLQLHYYAKVIVELGFNCTQGI